MINIYIIDINTLPDPKDITDKLNIFPYTRKDKMLRLSSAPKRKQALASSILMHKILTDNNLDFNDIYYGTNNKPLCHKINFNISHRKDIVICAASQYNIGCDIEMTDSFITKDRIYKMSKRFFHTEEAAFLEDISSDQSSLVYNFYRIWTIKESYVKMTGTGLTTPLNSYHVNLSNDNAEILIDNSLVNCSIMETNLKNYHISVCHEGPKDDILCTFVSHFLSGNN